MKAKLKPGYDKNRQRLADIVPLYAPFTIFIASTQICNFRCFYCTQGMSKEEKDKIRFNQVHMKNELFDKIVKDAKKFNGQVKRVVFTGLGEPLANPHISEMIKKLNDNNIAGGYEIITNAYLLTHEMTDRLLDAGITFLRVSIQGLTSKKYKEITGIDIDYDRLVDNIRYFYEKKGSCRLYVKIMDVCFEEGESEQDFYDIFGDICDDIYVEHLVDAQPKMKGKYGDKLNKEMTFYGDVAEKRDVCPYMFYSLQIDAEGNTFPCPPLGLPLDISMGNVNEKSLYDLWHSKKLYHMYEKMLNNKRNEIPYCSKCENLKCFTPKEDNLDNDKEQILKRLKEKRLNG